MKKEDYIKMEINTEKLYEQFKDIETQCLKDNRIVPDLISTVPLENRLSLNEKAKIKTDGKKIQEQYRQRRQEEISVIRGEHKKYDTIRELQEAELEAFLRDYPQFKDIING